MWNYFLISQNAKVTSLSCVIFLFHLTVISYSYEENNVCPTIKDYYTIKNNPHCWYDVAADSNVTEIIVKHGYPVEVHKVITADGYILSLFRIPNDHLKNEISKKGPILMQAGWLSTGANFLGRGKDSLAFLLADEGYDVWLGNFRGTEYAEEHVKLTVFDKEFWDYSIDELGLYDVPAQLELIAEKTGQKGNVIYIGHELGSTAAMVYSSSFPEDAKEMIKLFVFLAPVASVTNMIAPFRIAAPLFTDMLRIVDSAGLTQLVSRAATTRTLVRKICLESPARMEKCMQIANFIIYGPHTQIGAEALPVFFNQVPAGTAFKVLSHGGDYILYNFRRYDYGPQNINKYGTIYPPEYDVSKIEVPVFIMYAVSDWLSTKKDSLLLYSKLNPKVRYGIHEISIKNFNHIDFLFGRNVKQLVYEKLLSLLNKVS